MVKSPGNISPKVIPTPPRDPRSVGKSVVSTLVGIAIQQGKIHSLDDLITVYEPELKGTAWDGVTLKQLIQHTSGVEWNEDYTDRSRISPA